MTLWYCKHCGFETTQPDHVTAAGHACRTLRKFWPLTKKEEK